MTISRSSALSIVLIFDILDLNGALFEVTAKRSAFLFKTIYASL